MMVRRRSFLASFVIVGSLAVGASAEATTEPEGDVVAPLTGLPVDNAALIRRPALVIPIDNYEHQDPHAGLNEADLVFELMLFGYLNDPLFAHSGGNEGVNAALRKVGWTVLDQGDGTFRSDEFGNQAPHNLYANTSALFWLADDSGPVVQQFSYLPAGEEVDGPDVGEVALRFGNNPIVWSWHASAGQYFRSQYRGAHETATGQANATTVIVVAVPYGPSPAAEYSPEAQTVGTGDAIVYSNGRRVEGTWTRDSPTSTFTLEADGEPILIPPGRTWIEVVDVDTYELTES